MATMASTRGDTMKGKIAMLIAGLVLGSAGTAAAVVADYWQQPGKFYTCEGSSDLGAQCKRKYTGYEMFMSKSQISIFFRSDATFSCKPGNNPRLNCTDFRAVGP
jgi:hypothetical protein